VFDSNTRAQGTLVKAYPHLVQDPDCLNPDDESLWDENAVCGEALTVRQVMFTNFVNLNEFNGQKQKVNMLKAITELSDITLTNYTAELSLQRAM
jgi:hypothetical protein